MAISKGESLPTKPHKTAILVLGVDDEADLTLMRVLGALGCALPADMKENAAASPFDGFEPADVRTLNAGLFEKTGASWDDPSPFHPDWRQSPGAKAYVKHAVIALEKQFGNAALFALGGRDLPRLFPLWAEALRLFGCNIRPIVMLRNPLEAGQRAHDSATCSKSLSEIMWVRRALDAEHFTRETPRYFASFERLCQSWDVVIQDAQESLHVVWPKPAANVEQQITDILGDLRPSTDLQSRAMTSTLLPEWVRETYKILNGWAMSEEMAAHHKLLDALRGEFDSAADAFGRVVRAERHMQLANAATQRDRMQRDIATLSNAEAAAQAEREALRAGHEASQAELAVLVAERERLLADHEALLAAHDALAAERITLLADVARLEAIETECKAAKSALQEQRRMTTLLNAEVQELKDRRDDVEAALQEATVEVAATRARRKEMARVIGRRDAQLKARFDELAQLQKQIVQSDPVWRMKQSFERLKRRLRGTGS